MNIKTIKTGSSGNCYIVTSESGRKLLLDCGVPLQSIVVGLNFQINKVDGCIIGHAHSDHENPKTVERLINSGIYVWQAYKDKSHSRKLIGDFEVMSFDVPHDGTENRGFLIICDDMKLLYITDAEYCRHNFQRLGLDAILIECNFQSKYVDMNVDHLSHIYRGHMNLETCCEFLYANQTRHLKNVILCHLSHSNANPDECREAVLKAISYGAMVDVAKAGETIKIGDVTKGRENETNFY